MATMVEAGIVDNQENQEMELLEKYLPALSDRNRAYLKGMTKALLFAQESICVTKVEQPASASGIVKITK